MGVGNGGQQKMSLGNNCDWVEVTLHEFGHAIGFMHEQQRHIFKHIYFTVSHKIMYIILDPIVTITFLSTTPTLGEVG